MNRPRKKTAAQLEREGMNYAWMKMGAPVYYHAIIDEGPTHEGEIREEPWLLSGHTWVCMVTGKSGAVCCEAVTYRNPKMGAP